MLRTTTSHASRRQRQYHHQRGSGAGVVGSRIQSSSSSSSSSPSTLERRFLHHRNHYCSIIAPSSSISSKLSSSSARPLGGCRLPCCSSSDDSDNNNNHHHHHADVVVHSRRQYHSLSRYQQSSDATMSIITSSLSSLSINNNTSISATNNTAKNQLRTPITPSSLSTTTIQKRHKVFVSRHNNTLNLTPQSIVSYITAHLPHLNPNPNHSNSDFRITNSHVIMKECPFCPKPTNGKLDNQYKLYIQIGGGAYFCHRCGAKGSWYDFKSEVGGFVVDGTSSGMAASSSGGGGNSANSSMRAGAGGGGGVAPSWNWKTSNNNQGMNYMSTKQLITNPNGSFGHQGGNNNMNNMNNAANKQTTVLPMPSKKLNSIYTSKLFDPTNSPTYNIKEHEALQYLTQTRGLTRSVLRKYGVGCAPYNFPDKNAVSGISYVSSMCVTFPWLMRCGEVAEQEELRGAEFVWKKTEAEDESSSTTTSGKSGNGRKNAKKGRDYGTEMLGGKPKKKLGEMTALERYHYRREKKAEKERQEDGKEESSAEFATKFALGEHTHPAAPPPREELTAEDVEALYGPYITRRIKVRSTTQKSWQRLDPPGGGFGLFGWHTVPHDATELILTEGEFDAMAVYQATGRPAVSLPNGCRSLPMEVLVLLERFDSIYLWMDNDGPGREGAEMFARKLGVERCLLVQPSGKRGWNTNGGRKKNGIDDGCADAEDVDVGNAGQHVVETESNSSSDLSPACTSVDDVDDNARPSHPPKDANEALLQGWDLGELLDEASELPHERILKFSDLRDQVIHEIVNPEKYRGAPIPSLPGFTSLIKGFRRGEMTVLTGPTGSGKTTFLGQTSLDLAEQGINVLWGSFEIKNTRLMHKLLQQYMKDVLPVGLANKDMPAEERRRHMEGLTALADKFETLPMHFMKFHGGSDVDDVLDAMEYAAYVHDVEHIILDNMQFMISRQSVGKGSSYDKFDMQDIAVEKFRKFATEYNVHVTLVVHPRKEDEGAKLGMSSFYGSAKATQEADTVIILQSDGKRKFVDVKKNRFDGTLGHVPLHFQRKSGRYTETPEVNVPPPRTTIPTGVSALNRAKKQVNGTARASAGGTSIYHDIRNQHPT